MQYGYTLRRTKYTTVSTKNEKTSPEQSTAKYYLFTVSLLQVPISVDSRATKLPCVHYYYVNSNQLQQFRVLTALRCSSLPSLPPSPLYPVKSHPQ